MCKQVVKVGTDVYYAKGQGAAHWECFENPKPTAEAFALARELGFCEHDAESIQRMVPEWVVLRGVLQEDRSQEAQRDMGSTARRNPNATLFDT